MEHYHVWPVITGILKHLTQDLIRGAVLAIKENPYFEAAQAIDEGEQAEFHMSGSAPRTETARCSPSIDGRREWHQGEQRSAAESDRHLSVTRPSVAGPYGLRDPKYGDSTSRRHRPPKGRRLQV